jgi:hypothetical protein
VRVPHRSRIPASKQDISTTSTAAKRRCLGPLCTCIHEVEQVEAGLSTGQPASELASGWQRGGVVCCGVVRTRVALTIEAMNLCGLAKSFSSRGLSVPWL